MRCKKCAEKEVGSARWSGFVDVVVALVGVVMSQGEEFWWHS